MKRMITGILAVLLAVSLCGCGNTKAAKVTLADSEVFTEEEIQAAVACVESYFRWNYHDCTLLNLNYEEAAPGKKGDSAAENDGVQEDTERNEIVLWGEYVTGNNPSPGLSSNDWNPCMWTLAREDKDSEWHIVPGMCGWG